MSDPLIVVAAVFERDGKFLACRRAPHKADAGLWEFPGGKVEPGETPEEALAREIREELGVSVTIGRLVDRTVTRARTRPIDLATYTVCPTGPYPASSSDHDDLRWLARHELSSLEWALPDRAAVRLLAAAPTNHERSALDT